MVLRAFRFGVNNVTTTLREWQETAQRAEALGYSTLIAQDHFGPQLAPLPSLVAAGAVTSSMRLATIVLDNDFRHPATMAKEAATVDVLTDGRLELGLGAGWLEADYTKTGLSFDPPAQRLERLAETVQICKAFFASEEPVTFSGKHYQVAGLDASPRPVQQPRPPIMIGGRQRRMLSLAGREADIVSISLLDRNGPTFEQKLAWVREAAGGSLRRPRAARQRVSGRHNGQPRSRRSRRPRSVPAGHPRRFAPRPPRWSGASRRSSSSCTRDASATA